MKVVEIARRHGISDKTFYRWKSKYGGLSVKELKRIKELEVENSKLKKKYAELAILNEALKLTSPKKSIQIY